MMIWSEFDWIQLLCSCCCSSHQEIAFIHDSDANLSWIARQMVAFRSAKKLWAPDIHIQWESLQGWTKKKQDQLIRIGLEVKLHYYHKAMCPLGFMGELAARWFMKLHYIDPASWSSQVNPKTGKADFYRLKHPTAIRPLTLAINGNNYWLK